MSKEKEISRLFYDEHQKPTDIANKVNVQKSYVTKIIQKNEKYAEEKEMRKQQTKEKNKNCKRNYINKKRQADKEEYAKMQAQQNKDAKFLSAPKKMNDITFAKWNRSAYTYDSDSSDLLLKDDIITGYNAPKRVSNVVNPNSIKSSV